MMMKPIKNNQDISIGDNVYLAFAALLVGVVVGVIDTVFGQGLLLLSAVRDAHLIYLLPCLALAGLVIVFLYEQYGQIAKQGMGLVFDVGHGEKTRLPLVLIPLIVLSTWLTHLCGGSAGREGVAVQIGATVSHFFGRLSHLKDKSQLFLVMGMAAGFAGLFQTPMTAVVFALEVLLLGNISYLALLPSLIAAFTASWTSHCLGLEKFSVPIAKALKITPITFGKLVLLGLIFGLAGNLFASLLARAKPYIAARLPNPYYRVLLVGGFLSLSLLLCHYGRYGGLGTNLITAAFSHQPIANYDWLLKLLFTIITLSAGFQGGEVTPLFAIGAALGIVLAPWLGLPAQLAAALGYAAVFGSATNTFLAPIFVGLEVFGATNTAAYFIVVAFAYMVSRRHSIYTKQKVTTSVAS
ncbi:chloride channel protein [Streptococcus equi]|uniref:Voltage-gated chloride channel protein n=1 Tax=Streptococcus equi subsp. ruminatorum TaxID=254358 RepID=A0A6M1KSS2_9STRE|nr:chloride channel protein [Streptococcus equi]NGL84973.1 voltage-gated chloride channel protein [Streptococcus equi subsp. ruminatorum]